jgi:hypothetical protein
MTPLLRHHTVKDTALFKSPIMNIPAAKDGVGLLLGTVRMIYFTFNRPQGHDFRLPVAILIAAILWGFLIVISVLVPRVQT